MNGPIRFMGASALLVMPWLQACGSSTSLQARDARQVAVVVEDVRPLTTDRPPFPLVEAFLAVNPADASNLLVSAMSVTGNETVVFGSWDGGARWSAVEAPAGQPFPGGDPMLVFDGNGRAYLSSIAPVFTVWPSIDGGRTWSEAVPVGDPSRYDDRQWLAASPAPAASLLPLYGAAKTSGGSDGRDVIITTVSRDGGRTFAEPRRLDPGRGYLQAVTSLLVRSDGTVVMPYVSNDARLPDGRYSGRIWLRTSGDGVEYSAPIEVAEYLSYGEAGGDRRWKGLGVTPLAEDRSTGPHAGTLYMTWSGPIDDRLQILVTRSTDGGQRWSQPARVHDGGLRSNHSSPAVAVDEHGVVAITWNDRRDDPQDLCSRLYVAVSVDGGRTFAPDTRVAEHPTCPGAGSRWMNGGETHGLAALPGGGFRAVWTAGTAADLRLWTAVLRRPPDAH